MDQTMRDTGPRGSLQWNNNVVTAGGDINVTVNNPQADPMLTRLNHSLKPVTSAYYDSYEAGQRSQCLTNTRVQILSDIEKWVKDESHQAPIYILYGVAGIGKSTVAQTIAVRAAALGLLGASFFFSRDELERSGTAARHFFPTIAYQLAGYDNGFATHIGHSLDRNPDAPAKLLNQQLLLLLVEPLQNLLSQKHTPTLIVVDALDECEENGAEELLNLLGQHVPRMKGLKILITSRPEAHLRDLLYQDGSHEKFCLHDIEDSVVHSDIRLYLRFRLSAEEIRKVPRHRQTRWQPTDEDMEILCGMCGTLFIIAATVTKFILDIGVSPQKQLARLLDGVSAPDFSGSKYNNTLDHTYIRILCAPLTGHDEIDAEWLNDLNRVLGALITLAKPLPYKALASLLNMDPDELTYTLSRMHSLVAPTGNGANMTFRIHHKSFPDFITSRDRIYRALNSNTGETSMSPSLDSQLWVDVNDHHLRLAKACFRIMDCSLRINMANINREDWYKDKDDIPQAYFSPQIIPQDLKYVALQWASHLLAAQESNENLELRGYLDAWASHHILSWMEAMVILDQVNDIYEILQDAITSLREKSAGNPGMEQKRVTELLSDACRFVQQSSEVMKISPMHIYRSCLPFVPIATTLYKAYSNMVMFSGGVGKIYQWNPSLATLIGHSRAVTSVAFSANGSRVASGSHDWTVRLWDAKTGAHLYTFTGHFQMVTSVTFAPGGSRLASGSRDNTVRLWNATTGAHLFTFTDHSGSVTSVAFSADGSRLASGSHDNTVRLWDANTGAHLFTFTSHSQSVNSVAFSADNYRVASGPADRTVRMWDENTGAHLPTFTDHLNRIESVTFAPNVLPSLSQLVSQSREIEQLFDAYSGRMAQLLTRGSGWVTSIAFSVDGSRLASGSHDRSVRLWDATTGAHLSTFTGHSEMVTSIAFAPDGSRLASGSQDNTVRLWDATTGTHLLTLTGHTESVNSVAFPANGSRLASGSHDNTVRLWDANTGAHLSTFTGHSQSVSSIAFSADSSQVASGSHDNTVRLWDANIDAHLSTLAGHSDLVQSVAFSVDGSRLASGSNDKTVRLWDANNGAHLSTFTGHSDLVTSVAFSADGSQVASGSWDNTVQLWDANTNAHLFTFTGHSQMVNSVAFSWDGSRLASGSWDNTVRLWDVTNGAHLYTLTGHLHSVTSVAFSADGSQVVSGSDDRTLRLWNANTGAHLYTLIGHSRSVTSVAFSADGSRVVSGSDDKTLRLWNANTGAHIFHTFMPGSITSVFLLPKNSQKIDQLIFARCQPLKSSIRDSTSLLLLVERETPPITGIIMAQLMEEVNDFRWEVVPVCWHPPDIRVVCFSVAQSNPRIAIGCKDGRVMTLDFHSGSSNSHMYS